MFWFWIVLAFGLSVLLTPLVSALARRTGMVSRPRADRWHRRPTALLGGVAFYSSVAVISVLAGLFKAEVLKVFAAGSILFLVGLLDDIFRIRPYQKLLGQLAGALILLITGVFLPWTPWNFVNLPLTLLWIVGITNAINLLDNMDGLAAGVSVIASCWLLVTFLIKGISDDALFMGLMAAATAGFLVYNHNPASVFMGDCGALFLGQILAGMTLFDSAYMVSESVFVRIAVPVLILFVPILDTTLVTVLRIRAGLSIAQGGSDHTSHRLVALRLSERQAVWLLYALTLLSGAVALLARYGPLTFSLPCIVLFLLAVGLLAFRLARIRVYEVK